jgi:PhzF family phenazine biosynthesis protein
MGSLPYFHVNAFTTVKHGGNPAGVFILDEWPADDVLFALTNEVRLPISAFLVKNAEEFELRWFSPNSEEKMCGHGTLAASWAVFNFLKHGSDKVVFRTKGGEIDVQSKESGFIMQIPLNPPRKVEKIQGVEEAIGVTPEEYLTASYNIAVLSSGRAVHTLVPDLEKIAKLKLPGLIVTSTGEEFGCDIVTRYFAPAKGIPEDVATGSAHAQIAQYWQKRLGKDKFFARQLSSRGGEMLCEIVDDKLKITASVVPVLSGVVHI